jgi:hypothetical protein
MLLKIEPVQEILKRVFASGYIKNAYPLSAIIVAGIGGGKTSVLKRFSCSETNKGIFIISDVTAFGIVKSCYNELRNGKIRHIVIPDLITPMSKAKSTRDTFISFMNGLIEEGIMRIETYAVQVSEPIKCGLVTSIAKEDFLTGYRRDTWHKTGFISRMIPISYSYEQTDIIKILETIHQGIKNGVSLELNLIDKEIKIDEKMANQLIPYAMNLGKELNDVYPFRQMKQFIILAMANALLEGRETVEQKDIDWVKETACKYVNISFNPL